MPHAIVIRQALPTPVIEHIQDGCLASPFVSRSQLAGSFRESRGFGATFTRAGREALLERMGFLRAFLELTVDREPARALWPWPARLWDARRRTPNAFYLNLLLLRSGAGVGAHVDATLRDKCGDARALPAVVSVLYLEAPGALRGGELVLRRGRRELLRVRPEVGMLLHFRGDLTHEVRRLDLDGDARAPLRASLVCEQYRLSPAALACLPEVAVHSKAGFSAYLEAQRQRPLPNLVLDA